MSEPLAYFITFHTYGSWLHGRNEGSVDDQHTAYGQAFAKPDANRHAARQEQRKHPEARLDKSARDVVLKSLLETCAFRNWQPHALHVRANHVHSVITAVNTPPEKVLRDLKAYATRHLRSAKRFAPQAAVWSRDMAAPGICGMKQRFTKNATTH